MLKCQGWTDADKSRVFSHPNPEFLPMNVSAAAQIPPTRIRDPASQNRRSWVAIHGKAETAHNHQEPETMEKRQIHHRNFGWKGSHFDWECYL